MPPRVRLAIIIAIAASLSNVWSCAVADAQPTQAQYDSLKARVEFLERFVGTQYVGKSSAELAAALVPTSTLPGGRYPIFLSDYQIRVGLANMESGLQTQVSGLATRLATVETAAAGGQPVGTATFDIIRAKQICLGEACDPDWLSPLQIRTSGSSFIGFESNIAGNNPQSPRRHYAQISLGGDGGARIDTNCKMSIAQGFKCYIDPCREWTNIGTDSRGSWSYYRGSVHAEADPFTGTNCTPIPHDPTQDFVLTTDEAARKTVMYFWRPNWGPLFTCSSGLRTSDVQCAVQQ